MNTIVIRVQYPEGAYFPEIILILMMLPFVLLILNGVGAIYRNFARGYFFYLVTGVIYTTSWILRDYLFQYLRPVPDIVTSNHAKFFDISSFGFPDAGLAFVVAVLLSNVVLFGNPKEGVLIVTNFVILCLLSFLYWYTNLLYMYQIVFTYLFATVMTYLGIFLARSLESCWGDPTVQSHSTLLE